MDIDQKLRDFLSGLDGENSPITWQNKNDLINGIVNSKIKEIAHLHTIQLELMDIPLDYNIIVDEVYKYDFEDYRRRKIKFITEKDFELERNEEKNYELRRATERNLLPSTKFFEKDNLFNSIRRKKYLENHAVFCKHVLYESTYKIELFTSIDYSTLTLEELRLKYIGSYIREEIRKIRSKLKKYPESKLYNNHFKIIKFYRDQLIDKSKAQTDENLGRCYKLIVDDLGALTKHLKEYFGIVKTHQEYSDVLEWTLDSNHFKSFFDPLIDKGDIKYKGGSDKYSIFSVLLNNIQLKNVK